MHRYFQQLCLLLLTLVIVSLIPVQVGAKDQDIEIGTTGFSIFDGTLALSVDDPLEVFTATESEHHPEHTHESAVNYQAWLITPDGSELHLEGVDPYTLLVGAYVQVQGVQQGDTIQVAPQQNSITVLRTAPKPTATTNRKALVLLVNFSAGDEPFTIEAARKAVFDTGDNYLQEVSFDDIQLSGKLNQQGDVFGWLTIDAANKDCSTTTWRSATNKVADAASIDRTGYDHVLYVFASPKGCSWAGSAYFNSAISMYVAKYFIKQKGVIEHELGHNFGFYHANTIRCTDSNGTAVPLSDTCTRKEYNDPFDVMGIGNRYHYNSQRKVFKGWSPAATVVTEAGQYTLAAQETATSQPQAIQIAAPSQTTNFGTHSYWLELRKPYGFDSFKSDAAVVNGISVRLIRDYSSLAEQAYLIDAHPETTTFHDAPVRVGETLKLDADQLQIKVLSITNGVAQVQISFGEPSDTAAYLVNRSTGKYVQPDECSSVSNESVALVQVAATITTDCVQWEQVSTDGEWFYLRNQATGNHLRPAGCSATDNESIAIKQVSAGYTGECTQWKLVATSAGYGFLVNRATGKHMRPNRCSAIDDQSIEIRQVPETWTGNCTQWALQVSASRP